MPISASCSGSRAKVKDEDKTRGEIINELIVLRQRITEVRTREAERKRAVEVQRVFQQLLSEIATAERRLTVGRHY